MLKRSRVRIPAADTKWILCHIYLLQNLHCCLKRPKINKKKLVMVHLRFKSGGCNKQQTRQSVLKVKPSYLNINCSNFSLSTCQRQKLRQINYLELSSDCGSVGRAIASDTRGPRFKSSHLPTLYYLPIYCQQFRKNENK